MSALIALYHATDGANWTNNASWLTDKPLDTWHGVTVDPNGDVVGLDLRENNLKGRIPGELGNLGQLKSLSFPGNQLDGEIPSELGDLTNLTRLWLSENRLVGEIPPELGNLKNLERMWLTGNRLGGSIPPEIGNLSNLWLLQLSANRLTGSIPAELGNLTNLAHLRLSHNQLTGPLPEELSGLSGLIEIRLSGNNLSGCLPRILGSLADSSQSTGLPVCPLTPEDRRVPGWLAEGAAESTESRGVLIDRAKQVDARLEELESLKALHAGKPNTNAFSRLATELLESYAGADALPRYFALMQGERHWREAFKLAFKMPVEEFYFFFDEHRHAGFPEVNTYLAGHPSIIFGPDVDAMWRQQILDDRDIIIRWFKDEMGIDVAALLPEGYAAFVFGDGSIEGVKTRQLDAFIAFREELRPADRKRLKEGPAGLGWGFGHPEYSVNCTCRLPRTRLSFAHELIHSVQGNLAGDSWWSRQTHPPTWITEGTAEHLSRVLAGEYGMEKCSPNRCNGADSFNVYLVTALNHPPLATMETREGLTGLEYPYASGMVASAILAERAGTPSLMEIFALVGKGDNWRDAFERSFGMTVDEFYELYEDSKAEGFPEVPPEVRDLP